LALSRSYDEGIWIGKRTLGNNPIGLTYSPGFEFYHWCVMINGIIYQVKDKSSTNSCIYEIT